MQQSIRTWNPGRIRRILPEDYIPLIESSVKREGDCLTWTKGVDSKTGAPRFKYFTVNAIVTRVQYRLHKGEIPAKHIIKQTCKNKLCVNPQHLVAVPKNKEKSIDDWFTPCTDIREVWKKMGLI